jgi:FkbM family methyltransferase
MPAFVDVRERAALVAAATCGGVFVDIGANAGVYSLGTRQGLSRVGGGRVLAVEPNASVVPRLRRNLALNGFDSIVEVAEVALSDAEGEVSFTISSDNLGQSGVVRQEAGSRVTVPERRSSRLLESRGVTRVDGSKIDIEGAEDRVLLPFLAEAPDALLPRRVVIEDSRSTWNPELMAAFARRGYATALEARMNLVLARD